MAWVCVGSNLFDESIGFDDWNDFDNWVCDIIFILKVVDGLTVNLACTDDVA